MTESTITFRTDAQLKKDAIKLYESLGLNLSSALNMFLRQSVAKQKFPCSIEKEIASDYSHTYPDGFFDLFGSDTDPEMKIPEELSFEGDVGREML